MLTTTAPTLPSWFAAAGATLAKHVGPVPLLLTLPTGSKTAETLTVEVTAGNWSGRMGPALAGMPVTVEAVAHVRTVEGGVTVRGALHTLAGSLPLYKDGTTTTELIIDRNVHRAQPAGRSAWDNNLPAMKAGIDRLGPAADALAEAINGTGWGVAAQLAKTFEGHATKLGRFRSSVARGCRCLEGQTELGSDVTHWGCRRSSDWADQVRIDALAAAVQLVPYSYAIGTIEHEAARTLAPSWTGTPAELVASILAATHEENLDVDETAELVLF